MSLSNEQIKNILATKADSLIEGIIKDYPITESVTSQEMREYSIKQNRVPEELPNRLPTQGKNPLPIDTHKMIGMYESKQNLYLTFAHAYNNLMQRVEELEARVIDLEGGT